jgi:hypothetical protein
MKRLGGYIPWLLVVGAISFGLWWLFVRDDGRALALEDQASVRQQARTPVGSAIPKSNPRAPSESVVVEQVAEADQSEMSQEERHKEIDREHMKKIHSGIFAYREKYGNYPEYLSQLVPEFVEGDTIRSPKERSGIA